MSYCQVCSVNLNSRQIRDELLQSILPVYFMFNLVSWYFSAILFFVRQQWNVLYFVKRTISTTLRQPSSRRPDRRARISVPRNEVAKNVNCPAPSRRPIGLIGVISGIVAFHKATDYTPGRLIASTCLFRSVPRDVWWRKPADWGRGESCDSPGRSMPDILSIVSIEIDGLFFYKWYHPQEYAQAS